MIRFALVIFLSAFLLFQIQPIVAKYILPWFGGAANVWTVCMLFFQVTLLLGYLYAHLLNRFFPPKKQAFIHLILVGIALIFLPVTPPEFLKPDGGEQPLALILTVLIFTIGIPYMLISASGPLFQGLFETKYSGASTYRLYALSNIGSLLGLLSYPFIIEPIFSLKHQTYLWSVGFFLYFLFCIYIAYSFKNSYLPTITKPNSQEKITYEDIDLTNRFLWVTLAATGSALLLATTNQICLDIASIPFLWIVPLTLYLITFIICFDKPRWYKRILWIPLLFLSLFLGLFVLLQNSGSSLTQQILVFSSILFIGCMICHGELARLKPNPKYLTEFYLLISFGGAVGGLFVTLLSPKYFNGYWELHSSWVLILILAGICIFKKASFKSKILGLTAQASWTTATAVIAIALMSHVKINNKDGIYTKRNFYGIIKVQDFVNTDNNNSVVRTLVNGTIMHGSQKFIDSNPVFESTSYYSKQSGIGSAIFDHPNYASASSFSVGVVGMGVATIAALCELCTSMRFYEIDSDVVDVSKKHFSYLDKLKELDIENNIIIGDGRISLENELESTGSNNYDVLAVDAFSGDAIPVHLLTIEAFKLYWKHLNKNGILAVHISNRHLDLVPVVYNAAKELDKKIILIQNDALKKDSIETSKWMIITANTDYRPDEIYSFKSEFSASRTNIPIWTDDYSNLFNIIKKK